MVVLGQVSRRDLGKDNAGEEGASEDHDEDRLIILIAGKFER
jgi:hypothetical protein